MAFTQGSRASLHFIEETTFGTTPSTPAFIEIPINTHSLSLSKEVVEGNEIRSDRMKRYERHGNKSVGGDIAADLRKADYDPWLESMMLSSFSTNTLKVGTTLKTFTVEDRFNDISQFLLYTGVAVSSGSFSIAPNQMIATTFTTTGKDLTTSTSSAASTNVATSGNSPFDAYSGSLKIADTGGVLTAAAIVSSIDFTVDNDLSAAFVVGSDSTPQLEYGFATVTGTITAYVEDLTLLTRFVDETETALEVSVDDPTGSNPYTFLFPRAKLNGGDIPVDGPKSRFVTIPFTSLYDTTEDSNLVITRTA